MVIDLTSDINDYDIRFKKIYSKKYLELRGQFTNWISKIRLKMILIGGYQYLRQEILI